MEKKIISTGKIFNYTCKDFGQRVEAIEEYRAKLPALLARAEADGVRNVTTLVTVSCAVVAGLLGGYVVVYQTKDETKIKCAALAYKRNVKLRKGAKVHHRYVESTQETAVEYLQSISTAQEIQGCYVGAYDILGLASWSSQSPATFAKALQKAKEEAGAQAAIMTLIGLIPSTKEIINNL